MHNENIYKYYFLKEIEYNTSIDLLHILIMLFNIDSSIVDIYNHY